MTKLPLEKINKNLKININREKLTDSVKITKGIIEELEKKIKSETALTSITHKTIKDTFGLNNYTEIKDAEVVEMLTLYFKFKSKHETYRAVLEKLDNGTLKPEFYLTKTGNITCKNHSFNHISEKSLMDLLGYGDYIKFEKIEDMEDFIRKYFKLFKKFDDKSTYFIKSNTLYFTLNLNSYYIAYLNAEDRDNFINFCKCFNRENYTLTKEFLSDYNLVTSENSTFYKNIYLKITDFVLELEGQMYLGTPNFKDFYQEILNDFNKKEKEKLRFYKEITK